MELKINRSPKPNKYSLPGSMFYKEDMKEILAILKRKSSEGEVRVKVLIDAGEYEIEELGDLDEDELNGKRFRDMKFEASYDGSSVIVELLPESGSVIEIRKDEDIMMAGVADKVVEVARKRENFLKFVSLFAFMFAALLLLYFLSIRFLVDPIVDASEFLGFPVSKDMLVEGELLGVLGAIFWIPLVILLLKKMGIKGNTLVNSPRGKSHMFRDKLRRNWQVSAFWAVVSAVLGFLLGKLL
ncbi:putative membrane protein [Lipingzhangella halophila]|uniref:Putative membrane protein n=1 Tax=Lipingzhangella halophila TaxID=1783352 RepID=A0A7W7RMD5_9ACTN|nr:hypothetical protein [Lipingzhangella halophila]MBB4934611.1 putative membrane protein [Lipingzhangella halophila]